MAAGIGISALSAFNCRPMPAMPGDTKTSPEETALPINETNSNNSSSDAEVGHDAESRFVERGKEIEELGPGRGGDGFDAERMRARSLLTEAEEKALLRRIDWRIMTICSLLFLMKQLDADNVSNVKIMNRGTDRNILTELGMSSNQYNLVTVMYYVRYCTPI